MQVFLMLRTAYTLLRFCIFFISFYFGDDNISLGIKSYEIRVFFLLQWSCIYNFKKYIYDERLCKHRNISLCMILLIEYLCSQDQVSLMAQAILLKYNFCKIQ